MTLKILDNSGTDARGSLPRMTHSFCNSRSVWQSPLWQPGNEVLRQTDAHLFPPKASVYSMHAAFVCMLCISAKPIS